MQRSCKIPKICFSHQPHFAFSFYFLAKIVLFLQQIRRLFDIFCADVIISLIRIDKAIFGFQFINEETAILTRTSNIKNILSVRLFSNFNKKNLFQNKILIEYLKKIFNRRKKPSSEHTIIFHKESGEKLICLVSQKVHMPNGCCSLKMTLVETSSVSKVPSIIQLGRDSCWSLFNTSSSDLGKFFVFSRWTIFVCRLTKKKGCIFQKYQYS